MISTGRKDSDMISFQWRFARKSLAWTAIQSYFARDGIIIAALELISPDCFGLSNFNFLHFLWKYFQCLEWGSVILISSNAMSLSSSWIFHSRKNYFTLFFLNEKPSATFFTFLNFFHLHAQKSPWNPLFCEAFMQTILIHILTLSL